MLSDFERKQVEDIRDMIRPFVHADCDNKCTRCGISNVCLQAIDLYQACMDTLIKEEKK